MNKFITILTILIPFFCWSQKDTNAYIHTFGGYGNDVGNSVVATHDNGFIIVGSTATSGDGNTDVYLLKIDSLCNYQWSFAIGENNNDWGYAIKQTFDKGFIIAASSNSYGNGGYDAVLIKRDSVGNYEWLKPYGGNDWDFAYDVVQTFDSGFAFCGETYNNTNGFSDVWVVKTNVLGDTLWTKTIGGNLSDKAKALIETSDSNLVVVGSTNTLTDSTQAIVLVFDKNGNLLWQNTYGGAGYETANDVIQTQDGNLAFVGSSTSLNTNNDLDHYFLKIDFLGNILNQNTLISSGSSSDDDEANTIMQLNDGRFAIAGYTKTWGFSKKDVHVFLLSNTGAWIGVGSTFGLDQDEEIFACAKTTNDRMIFVGQTNTYGMGNNDVLVIRLDTIYDAFYANQSIYSEFEDVAPIGITEQTILSNSAIVFPNPAKNFLTIITSQQPVKFYLNDIAGKTIKTDILLNNTNKIDVSNLKTGYYTLQLIKNYQIVESHKIILTK